MKCFKEHENDNRELYKIKPISEMKVLYSETVGNRTNVHYEVDCLTCEELWHTYQAQAYEIIAPGGRLIRDPQKRNAAINAAYARLWLYDNRFQWAGLAAFASKQVGCGLLHATDIIMKMQAEDESAQKMLDSTRRLDMFGLSLSYTDDEALREYQKAYDSNPMPTSNVSHQWSAGTTAGEVLKEGVRGGTHKVQSESYRLMEKGFRYVHEMLAMGNTALFLDVWPLHAFYAKRGLKELKMCLVRRKNIANNKIRPVYWPVKKMTFDSGLQFGLDFDDVIFAFEAVERGDIAESVRRMARHEQVNILQRIIYSDLKLVSLLRGNQISYVTNLPAAVAQPVELTLANQCKALSDGRTVGFSDDLSANLADPDQRMPFVLRAADQFDALLMGRDRNRVEEAINAISSGVE